MKYYDITIQFTLTENEYKRFDKNINTALNLILPYGKDYTLNENEYMEDE